MPGVFSPAGGLFITWHSCSVPNDHEVAMAEKILLLKNGDVVSGSGPGREVPFKSLIPDDHVFFFKFLSMDLTDICRKIEDQARRLESAALASQMQRFLSVAASIHPFFKNRDNGLLLIGRTLVDSFSTYDNSPLIMDNIRGLQDRGFFLKDDIDRWVEESYSKPGVPLSWGLRSLQEAQSMAKLFTAMLLDVSYSEVTDVPPGSRELLYNAVLKRSGEMPPPVPERSLRFNDSAENNVFLLSDSGFLDRACYFAKDLSENGDRNGAAGNLARLVRAFDRAGVSGFQTIYEIKSFESLVGLELWDILSSGVSVKRCSRCGRFYAFFEGEPEYCTIEDKKGTSCRAEYLHKMSAAVYRKAYKTHHARVRRNSSYSEGMFEAWKDSANKLKEELLDGRISLAEYERSLQE